MKAYLLKTLLLGAILVAPVTAWSIPLPEPIPPSTFSQTTLSGTTAVARPELAGVVLEDVFTPFSFSGNGNSFTGQVENMVVQSSLNGTMDFYWRIITDVGSDVVTGIRITGNGGYALDADWRIDSTGSAAPDYVNYGGLVNDGTVFVFSNGPEDGESSHLFFLDTQATAYAKTKPFDLFGGPDQYLSPIFTTFGPAGPVGPVTTVPEPSTLLFLGSGLIGAAWLRSKFKS